MTLHLDVDEVTTRRREDAHVAQLEYEQGRNTQRIALLEERQAKIVAELSQIRAKRERRPVAEPGVRTIGEDRRPERPLKPLVAPGKDQLADATLRDNIVLLGTFTIPELAAMCKVKPGTVKSHPLFQAMCGDGSIKNLDERYRGQARFEYVRPEEPGKAFELQVAAEPPSPEEAAQPIEGTGNNPHLNALDKTVRKAVRAGMRDGWTLHPMGSGHFELRREGFRAVSVSATPRNAGDEANHIRNRLRTARPLRAASAAIPARGRPIAHTGRTPGTSGKPGRDRKVAQQIGRQPKKRRET